MAFGGIGDTGDSFSFVESAFTRIRKRHFSIGRGSEFLLSELLMRTDDVPMSSSWLIGK